MVKINDKNKLKTKISTMWKFIHVLTTLFVTFGSSNADIISLNENWLIESSDGSEF